MIFDFDLEPPSSSTETSATNKFIKSLLTRLREALSYFAQLPNFCKLIFLRLREAFTDSRIMPHFAISSLLVIVVLANFAQRSKAEELASQLIPLDPAMQTGIADTIDPFTPTIKNDSVALDK